MAKEDKRHLAALGLEKTRRIRLIRKASKAQARRMRRFQAQMMASTIGGAVEILGLPSPPPSESPLILRGEIDELLEAFDEVFSLYEEKAARVNELEKRCLARGIDTRRRG